MDENVFPKTNVDENCKLKTSNNNPCNDMGGKKEICISDLTLMEPHNAISKELEKDKWRAVSYETAEVKGNMLMAWSECRVPHLKLDPKLSGWYEIHVGMYWASDAYEQCHRTVLKLSGDAQPVMFEYSNENQRGIYEFLWKSIDMSDQFIEIIHPNDWVPVSSCIAHFRFVPLSDEKVEALKRERTRTDTRRILATHDMTGVFYLKNPGSADEVIAELEPYRNTDVERLLIEYVVDIEYPETPTVCSACLLSPSVFPREGDKNVAESLRRFVNDKIDFYPPMINFAHDMGSKLSHFL